MKPGLFEENLVFFPCGDDSLAGVLTVPSLPNGRTVLMPWGGGAFPSSGRNQVRARVARTLAEGGFHSFRFDYRGVGESDGEFRRLQMEKPNTEEILAACAWLVSQGLTRIVIVAQCFGGWSSLLAAPMIEGLEGMAVVNSPVWRDHRQVRKSWRWWTTRLKRLRLGKLRSHEHRAAYRRLLGARASSLFGSNRKGLSTHRAPSRDMTFSGAVAYLVDRKIPFLLVYGNDDFRADFELELNTGLRAWVEKAQPLSRLVMVPEQLAKASLEAQDLLLDELVPWLGSFPEGPQLDTGRSAEVARGPADTHS